MLPLAKEKFSEKPVISPKSTVMRLLAKHRINLRDAKIPKLIFLSLSVGATVRIIAQTKAKEIDWIYKARPLYFGTFNNTRIGIIWAAPSAPVAAMFMEDLIACGSRTFIGIGLAAAIQPNINVGDIIIPTSAIRDEGTSYHYLPKNTIAIPDSKLANRLRERCKSENVLVHTGEIWTTDAPYRETPSKIRYFAQRKVLGVDMETSVIFSLAMYRKVKAACVLVASTNLSKKKSDMGFYDEKLNESLDNSIRISLEEVN